MFNISSFFPLLLLIGLSGGLSLCPPNEEEVECINFCNTCEDGDICYGEECIPGCDCLPGYVRNEAGECIPRGLCPLPEDEESFPVCPPNEHFDECFGHCQKNCSNRDRDIICLSACFPGCVCNQGFIRGPQKRCIRPEKCPARPTKGPNPDVRRCRINEIFSKCGAHCQRNCSNYKFPAFQCPKICVPGCVCVRGLVRGPKGNCIPPQKCPSKTSSTLKSHLCPLNEEYSRCEAHCQRNCTNYKDPVIPCPKICVSGCVCKKGRVRGPKGNCILPRQCPPLKLSKDVTSTSRQCPINEEFSKCTAHCQKNCTNYSTGVPCPKICVPGCVCVKGMVRGPQKSCIFPQQCPPRGSS